VSITEQRALALIAQSCTPHGQGSQSHRLHEPIVRARAADCHARVFKRGVDTSPENSHAVHHRRHPVGRVATGVRRDLHDRLIRPRAIGGCDRARPRGARQRATGRVIATIESRPCSRSVAPTHLPRGATLPREADVNGCAHKRRTLVPGAGR